MEITEIPKQRVGSFDRLWKEEHEKEKTDRESSQRMGERVKAEMPVQGLGSLVANFLYMEDK